MRRVKLGVYALMLCGLCAAAAFAGVVQVQLSSETTVTGPQALVRLDVRNEGSEPLLDIAARLHLEGNEFVSERIARLLPGDTLSQRLLVPLPPHARGRYLLPLWLLYHTAAGQSLAAVHVAELNTAEARPANLRLELAALHLEGRDGGGRLSIHNAAASSRVFNLRAVTPPSLHLGGLPDSLRLAAGAEMTLPFKLEVEESLISGAYPVFVLASFTEEDLHYAQSVAATVRVGDSRSLPARFFAYTQWIYTLAALLAAWVVMMAFYDIRRRP